MSSSSVDDLQDKDLFTQDGVLLQACVGRPVSELNSMGTLCIVESHDGSKCVEWRPNDLITVDSDTQDQEWAVVHTLGRRTRTLSGNLTSDYLTARARIVKIPLSELKMFKISKNNQQLQFMTKLTGWQTSLNFTHRNADIFIQNLLGYIKTAKMKHGTYVVVEPSVETNALNKSFAELDIFTENTTDVVWNLVSNLKQRPYETTLEAFSKLTNIVYYGNEAMNGKRDVTEEVADLLTRSMSAIEEATQVTKSDEYEVISVKPTLPPRPCIPRGSPLTAENWSGLQDSLGRVAEIEGVKQLIFRGGISPNIRKSVWKFVLNYYPWNGTYSERKQHHLNKSKDYYRMKQQWKSITLDQESRFSEFRDRKSLVEKDVNRTDRTHPFFAGDDNPNLVVLQDILMTYVMYNFDLGYVQGMSDILAPLLLLLNDEVESFWCFVGFMDKIASNFEMDQAGMKLQLLQLQQLLTFASPALAQHLAKKDSGNMYFCFRWLLVWFKREFSHLDIMRLWEVLWTGLPCDNFHLLICVAILDAEKDTIMGQDYGFTEVLKHVNDLSMRLNVDKVLSDAEGIYHQIISAHHLTDQIRIIIGLQPLGTSTHSDQSALATETNGKEDREHYTDDKDEVMYQTGLDFNF